MPDRILLISSNSSGRGGGERYLVYLTQGLRSIGCEVHALLSSVAYMDTWASELAGQGAQVHRRNLRGLRHRPLRFFQSMSDRRQQRLIAQTCRDIGPDVILVNQQYDEDGLDYVSGALLSGAAPVGGLMHNPMTATKDQRPLGKLRGRVLGRWYKRHSYTLLLVSEGSRRDFEQYYAHPRPTKVVHPGILFDPPSGNEVNIPPSWLHAHNSPVIGFTGQFEPVKNLTLLIESWLWVRRQGLDARLLLVGDGPERAPIEEILNREAPAEAWHITGWQERPEEYLPYMDIFAMTSITEGCPLALVDAVGRGIPAVVTNFNGALDVASKAPWVKLVGLARPESVGSSLLEAARGLNLMKQQAEEGARAFRTYFSLRRMAEDTVAAICR